MIALHTDVKASEMETLDTNHYLEVDSGELALDDRGKKRPQIHKLVYLHDRQAPNHAETSSKLSRRSLMQLAGTAMIGAATWGLDGCKRRPTNSSNVEGAGPIEDFVVDDFAYYRAVESATRDEMKIFETEVVLPLARTAVRDGGFESRVNREQAVEGYYHETQELQEVFFLIRTLQASFTAKKTQAIVKLHNIYDPRRHPVFGLKQAYPTAINSVDVLLPLQQPVTISPIVDPISQASSEVVRKTGGPNWTVDNIMNNVDAAFLGTSLVGMAYLVDSKTMNGEHWNPLATCLACETTVLSRFRYVQVGGYKPKRIRIVWKVSPDVRKYGERVIRGYNKLFKDHGYEEAIPYVTRENVMPILQGAPEIERVVCINVGSGQGTAPRYYHWSIVRFADGKYAVRDFFSDRIHTTQEWMRNPESRRILRD